MKINHPIIAILFLMISFLVISCGSNGPVKRLERLVTELESSSDNYTVDDWSRAIEKYQQIETDLEKYTYSEEEYKEIARLKGKCYGYLAKGAIVIGKEELGNQIDYINSAIEGFFDGIK